MTETFSRPEPGAGPFSMAVYLALTRLAAGLGAPLLKRRLAAGKEDPERWREKLGYATLERPEGRLLWIHAVSVGEGLSILPLLKYLVGRDTALNILVTSTTVTSAQLLVKRVPEGCILQFLPLDTAPAVRRFLDHWRPDAAVLVESELWPRLIHDTHDRGIPLMLMNARVSEASNARWAKLKNLIGAMLERFSVITAPDALSAERLIGLGAPADRTKVVGSLKGGAERLPVDRAELHRMEALIGERPRWLAASTHPGEEEMMIAAHVRAADRLEGLLLVLAPRHPNRADEICETIERAGLKLARRSAGDDVTAGTDIYVADTLGEMGLWFDLCPVAFIGGSLVDVGGHNAYEPALHGTAILHGPQVSNFEALYRRLSDVEGAVRVSGPDDLADVVAELLTSERRRAMAEAARSIFESDREATMQTGRIIEDLLAQTRFNQVGGAVAGSEN